MEYIEYQRYQERRYEYDEMVTQLAEVLQKGRNYVADGADAYLADLEKVMRYARRYDDYEQRASLHLEQAVAVMAEKIERYTTETADDMNTFLSDYPHRFYVIGGKIDEPAELRRVDTIGEGRMAAIAVMYNGEAIDTSDGGYQLLIDSRTIDT